MEVKAPRGHQSAIAETQSATKNKPNSPISRNVIKLSATVTMLVSASPLTRSFHRVFVHVSLSGSLTAGLSFTFFFFFMMAYIK